MPSKGIDSYAFMFSFDSFVYQQRGADVLPPLTLQCFNAGSKSPNSSVTYAPAAVEGSMVLAPGGICDPSVWQTLYQTHHWEVDSSWSSPFSDGKFQWSCGSATKTAVIGPYSGDMHGGSLSDMMNMPAVIGSPTISYGFYDAPPNLKALTLGASGACLTHTDQAYVCVTRPPGQWMHDFAVSSSPVSMTSDSPAQKSAAAAATVTLGNFIVPGSHDCGTFDLTLIKEILTIKDPSLWDKIRATSSKYSPSGMVVSALSTDLAKAKKEAAETDHADEYVLTQYLLSYLRDHPDAGLNAVINLSVTQNNNITTQLELGCRYFDFRPGYVIPEFSQFGGGRLYHQHGFIPGYPFSSFLEDILNWLKANPGEIVIVNCNSQGFVHPECMIPTAAVLQEYLDAAIQATQSFDLRIGDRSQLGWSYETLAMENTRLFFLNQISNWYPATKYDSYSDAYNTFNPQNVIGELNKMNMTEQQNDDYTVLQLQGTATLANMRATVASALSTSKASSLLLGTKAMFDAQTYPWVLRHSQNLNCKKLVVALNDFVDNGLTAVCARATQFRHDVAANSR